MTVSIPSGGRDEAADFMFECAPLLGDCCMKNSVEMALRVAFKRIRAECDARQAAAVEAMRVKTLEDAHLAIAEQRCERGTSWDRAMLAAMSAIRSLMRPNPVSHAPGERP